MNKSIQKLFFTATVTTAIVFSGCTLEGEAITKAPNTIKIPAQNSKTESEPEESSETPKVTTQNEHSIKINIEDTMTINRNLVAKMIGLTFYDKNQISAIDREISFADTAAANWYDKYINAVSIDGYMSGADGLFRPNENLTLNEAQLLINKMDKNNTQKIHITEENKNKPISYALWCELYFNMLDNISGDTSFKDNYQIQEKNIIIMATKNNNENLGEWNLITDNGPLNYEGFDMSYYLDKEITVLLKGNEIICVLGVKNESPTIKSAYLVKSNNESITIFSGGIERTYKFAGVAGEKNYENKICDIEISNGTCKSLKVYTDQITSTIKQVGAKSIELDKIGIKNFSENIKIYSVTDGVVKWKSIANLTVGTDIAYYTIDNANINAAIITKTSKPFNLRVALNTTGFASLIHKDVTITSDENFIVKTGEETKEYKAGEELHIAEGSDLFGQQRISVNTKSGDGKISVKTIKRNNLTPAYRGVIEIAKGNGGFVIVNEVDLDQYLYSVVPSEMPTRHGIEAAKVQAVTARSYAYMQYYANKFHEYGANVDDSVLCQVYNNVQETSIAIEAVNATKGLCVTYNDEVISTNFFSTSAGHTANSGEVWTTGGAFPSDTKEYLQATKQYSGSDFGNLSNEENAYKFLKETNIDSYDKNFTWFRWNVAMTKEELTNSINKAIKTRYNANNALIKTLADDGHYRSKPIESIGELKDLEIVKRGAGGNIMQLKIVGTEKTVMVYTEYNIRLLLAPAQFKDGGRDILINRIDKTQAANYSLMPSSFFVTDKTFDGDNLKEIKFFGGGNGHGVGMSQNGVKGMIDKGFTFDEIIKHYFKGTEIKNKF